MTQMNMIQAFDSAMDVMMARDPSVVVMGEDVGYFGGVFRATEGLQRKYGEHRVLDTPIAEGGIVATAIGMSVNGLRPVAEIQFADYMYPAYDQIISELAASVIAAAASSTRRSRSARPAAAAFAAARRTRRARRRMFAHVSGIKVVMPSNPYDAKGLLIAAIEDDDPVIFFEPKRLYSGPFDGDPNKPAVGWSSHPKGDVPDGHYRVAVGVARHRAPRQAGHYHHLRHDGACVHRCRRVARRRRRSDRPALDRAAGRGDDHQLGEEDRPLRRRARGDALRRLRRGNPLDRPGRMFLAPGSADPARRRLGHSVSARVRVGILSGPGARRGRNESNDGGVMSRHVVKLPDLGEGTVSSEIVAWHVKVGDQVTEDQPMVEMSTDKAVVEMPSPVAGRVVSLGGQPGDHIAVGAELIVLETAKARRSEPRPRRLSQRHRRRRRQSSRLAPLSADAAPRATAATRPAARAPAACWLRPRRVARAASPASISQQSSAAAATVAFSARTWMPRSERRRNAPGARPASPDRARQPRTETEEIRILGVRRVSAQRVAESKRNIPHFSYVEEVDITELERLRKHLNSKLPKGAPTYTYLPFLGAGADARHRALPEVQLALRRERNVLVRHRGVHIGVATQTSDGLKVPVVHHAETLSLSELAAEIRRVAQAARDGTASRSELSGSTITITSLGKLGGIVSTPIINAPEVAIIGVNKAVERPVVLHGADRRAPDDELSSSFDHRFIDGYDAAEIIQALKEMLEQPATIFIDGLMQRVSVSQLLSARR